MRILGPTRFGCALFVALLLGLICTQVHAAPQWIPIGPFGGYVNQVRFSATQRGVVYAAGANGVYISRNGGISWAPVGAPFSTVMLEFTVFQGFPVALDVVEDRAVPGDLFAITADELLRYHAATNTWRVLQDLVGNGGRFDSIVADPFKPGHLIMGGVLDAHKDSLGGFFESEDSGRTLKPLPRVHGASAGPFLQISALTSGMLAASDPPLESSTAISTNAGFSWKGVELAGDQGSNVSFAGGDANRLYGTTEVESGGPPTQTLVDRSDNGGNTWHLVATVTNPIALSDPARPSSLVPDPHDPDKVYMTFSDSGEIFVSADGGETWSSMPHDPDAPIRSLAVDPFDGNHLIMTASTFFGAPDDVLSSWDGGVDFTATDTGITAYQTNSVVADPETPSTFYAGTPDYLYKSLDAGAHWERQESGNTFLPVVQMTADPLGTGSIYIATPGAWDRYDEASSTWTFTDLDALLGGDFAADPHISPSAITDGVVYASLLDADAEQAFLLVSTDDGATWSESDSSIFRDDAYAIASSPQTVGKAYSLLDGAVRLTLDGGQTWTLTSLPSVGGFFGFNVMTLGASSDDTLFVAGGTGISRTTDGGSHWTTVYNCLNADNCDIRVLYADPVSVGTLYAGSMEGNLESDDGGSTWGPLSAAGLDGRRISYVHHPTWAPSVELAGTFDAGAFLLTDPADIAVHLSGGINPVTLGTPVTYQATVTNNSQVTANNVTLVLDSPANASFTIADAGGSICTDESSGVTVMVCRIPQLAAGAQWVVGADVTLASGADAFLHAVATTGQGDTNLGDNADTALLSSQVLGNLAIHVNTVANSVTAGRSGRLFTVVAKNTGSQDSAAIVEVFYSGSVKQISAQPEGAVCTAVRLGFKCTITDLAAGSSGKLHFSGTLPTAGDFSITASIKSAGMPETDTSDNSASAQITVVAPKK